MINVLIIEDEREKREAITVVVENYFAPERTKTVYAETFAEASKEIYTNRFELIIADLLLPRRPSETPVDFSEDLLDFLQASDKNARSTVVAISRFSDVVDRRQIDFTRAGVFLLNYSHTEEWKSCLRICMQRVEQKKSVDFVIICALEEERGAFRDVDFPDFHFGEMTTYQGLDCREFRIGSLAGVCVLQPRMGLVDATAISAFALSAFSPKLLCMAGICAGFSSEVELGALLVSDVCWEHQAGKWSENGFELSHYQEPMDNGVRTKISQMIQEDPQLISCRKGLREIPSTIEKSAYLIPTVSGSAVIASEKYQGEIRKQHRKVGGLDMEVYGLMRAKALYPDETICFAAKTVVDHADKKKSDILHQAGAILSARFVVRAIEKLLA